MSKVNVTSAILVGVTWHASVNAFCAARRSLLSNAEPVGTPCQPRSLGLIR